MPTNIITTGTTAANSADQVITTTPVTYCLKGGAAGKNLKGAYVDVLLKDDAGVYWKIDQLTFANPTLVISAPGTYRFSRRAGVSCGLFSG